MLLKIMNCLVSFIVALGIIVLAVFTGVFLSNLKGDSLTDALKVFGIIWGVSKGYLNADKE